MEFLEVSVGSKMTICVYFYYYDSTLQASLSYLRA